MRKTPASVGSDGSRGMILIIVLWAISLMTVMIAALSVNVQRSLILRDTETQRMKSEMFLEGGIDIAAAALVAHVDKSRRLADGHSFRVDLGGGSIVEVSIRGAGGLVDINRADPRLLESIIGQSTGSIKTGQVVAKQILEFREKANPLEEARENKTGQSHQALAFMSVFQLYGLNDTASSVVNKFLPFVSLYSVEGHVNPAFAPEAVLASIPGITAKEVSTLVSARRADDWQNPQVEQVLTNLAEFLSLDESDIFIVDLRLIAGVGLIPGTRLEATLLIDKDLDIPYRVLSWSW